MHQSEADKLKRLQKDKSPEEQHKLAAAECALVHCADSVPDSDPAKSGLVKLQSEDQAYTKEQDDLKRAGAFDGYGAADKVNDI